MLGHVAQSVGGALPGGRGGALPFVAQIIENVAVGKFAGTVPAGASFYFAEIVAAGASTGGAGTGSPNPGGGGGGGSDAIGACSPGEAYSGELSPPASPGVNASQTSTLSIGNLTLTVTGGSRGSSTVGGSGGAGKYPGTAGGNMAAGSSGGLPGKGGGRLSGPNHTLVTSPALRGRPGNGGTGDAANRAEGGYALAVFTFFRTLDEALAFANSLYGGNWQP